MNLASHLNYLKLLCQFLVYVHFDSCFTYLSLGGRCGKVPNVTLRVLRYTFLISRSSDTVKESYPRFFCLQCLDNIRTKPFHLILLFYIITSKTRSKQCSKSDLHEKKQFITFSTSPILNHSKDL